MEMFKEYVSPKMEFVLVEVDDLIVTSGLIPGLPDPNPDPEPDPWE